MREALGRPAQRHWVSAAGDRASVDGLALTGFLLAEAAAGELHILTVAVEPAKQRRGIGAALLAATLDAGRAEGLERALLELRASNDAAEALYRRHGFVVVGRRPRYYRNAEDAVLMTLELSAPST